MRQARVGIIFAMALLLLGGTVVSARERPDIKGADRVDTWLAQHNLHPAFDKLGRGVSNFLLGWLEIPLNMQKRYTASDTIGSRIAGAGIGAFKGAIRMGVGFYETITFFFPYPEHYAQILPTLEYFDRSTKRKRLLLE